MENLNQDIESYYLKEGLYEDIVSILEERGIDLNKVKRLDIAGVDEFHVRGAAVSKELANSIKMEGVSVLDIGCGLGGPCRMLAEEFNCKTTGLDLSNEYIKTAGNLSNLLKLSDKTTFVQGNATELPFEDNSFDVVWTQHVQMNIHNKKQFYSEITRVLKNGGYFLFYDVFRNVDGEITYPVPWASHSDISFLFKGEEMHNILNEMGLVKEQITDQTQAGIDFFDMLAARPKKKGTPKMGLNILMGEMAKLQVKNLFRHLKAGDLELVSGVYRK